ncbi:HAUS augmin-like complex subunit 8 isoform X2 [Pogoniulus pusillus]|uniref:HAUS augmin-like complex subunit 8 isoform X2 n=1 Tax=Pogoniulus pusillus TaxID=488313 RepID=UPI0030B974CE
MADSETSKTRRQGGVVVKSRYLQCHKKSVKKDNSASSFSKSAAEPTCTTKPTSVLPRKCKTGAVSRSLNQSCADKNPLQSTLLGEDKSSLPDLDLSAIGSGKNILLETPVSKSACEEGQKLEKEECSSGTLVQELNSMTLLFTYLRVKAEKNLSELEKRAEQNLLKLCEEKERQREKLSKLKREILLREREQKLSEALDKQMEVLSCLVPVCDQFKEQYKSFAVALDATRHELPTKNIHIGEDRQAYLEELQKEMTITQGLLTEVMPRFSGEGAKACSMLKELKELSQKVDKELQRSFTQVQNLSFQVSKEVSLHNQQVCEEKHGLDVVKHWYFG